MNETIIITGHQGLIGSSIANFFLKKRKYQVIGIDKKDGIDLSKKDNIIKYLDTCSKDHLMKTQCLILAHGQPDLSVSLKKEKLEDFESIEFEDMIKNNLSSHFIIIQEIKKRCPFLTHIIFLGSIFNYVVPRHDGYGGKLKNPAYPSSKFGSLGLMKYLAEILGSSQIQVNMISPGPVRKNISASDTYWLEFKKRVPLGKPTTLEEINLTISFLLLSKSITGQNIILDGGYTLT